MPIYAYRCEACEHSFEVLQKMSEDPLKVCPECDAEALKKLLSAPNFHLKGKGWKNSDEKPKKTNVEPKFGHMFDSPTPHADHDHEPASAKKKDEQKGHAHGSKKPEKPKEKSSSHGHSHSHSHSHGHKH